MTDAENMNSPQNSAAVEVAISPTLDKFVAVCEPAIRKVVDGIYGELLETVQDYLRSNAVWNIGAEIDRCRAIERENAALQDANKCLFGLVLQYRDDLRRPPSDDSRDRRLAAINAAIAAHGAA